MVLPSRRALSSLRRPSNRPCGLLVPSANLPPRPIYHANLLSKQSRYYSSTSVGASESDRDGWELVNSHRCFGCGEEGHKLAECPSKGQSDAVNWKNEQSLEQQGEKPVWQNNSGENMWKLLAESKCFTCGQPGHKTRSCPMVKGKKRGVARSGSKQTASQKKVSVAEAKKTQQDMQQARELLGLRPDDEVLPSAEDTLNWPKDYEQEVINSGEFNKLPEDAKRALRAPGWWQGDPITAENLMKRLNISDAELNRLARGRRIKGDVTKKKHGAVEPIRKSDVEPEDLKDVADLRELNTLIRDDRFSEAELRDIMADEGEPENDILLLRQMIEETQRDMHDDAKRLLRHEDQVLKEEIKTRMAQGMTREKAEHDARAIMRLPQKSTLERIELTRDLSEEAIHLTETMTNDELLHMGAKGRHELMRRLDKEHQYLTAPLKPSDEEGYDMFPTPPPRQEGEDHTDPKIWEWNSTDMSSMAHSELQEHREARQYSRLAVFDMPRLGQFAKPFRLPTEGQVLRFRYTTHLGAPHPSEKKVVMECCPDDFDLTKIERDKLIKICGPRFNPEKRILKFSCEMFPHQHQNKRYLGELIEKLVAEAKDATDTFEDVPFDFRHHKFKPPRQYPKSWRMRNEELELKRLRDWAKNATPEEWQKLKVYVTHKFEERRLAEEVKQKAL